MCFHGRAFSTHVEYQLLCPLPHTHTHLLPKKPLKRMSLAEMQHVPTVRPPTVVRVQLCRVPKTSPSKYHHYQTPQLEPLGICTTPYRAFKVYILKLLIYQSHSFVPCQRVHPFCTLHCHTNTKAKQPRTCRSFGDVYGKMVIGKKTGFMYVKPFQLPRLVIRPSLGAQNTQEFLLWTEHTQS